MYKKVRMMKKLFLSVLFLPLSLPLFADQHIEKLSLRMNSNPQTNLSFFCFSKSQKSISPETLEKNLVNAGFGADFMDNTTIVEFITSDKKITPFEMIIHTTNEVNRYNKEHETNINNYRLIQALFAHDPKMQQCLDLTSSLFDTIPNAADQTVSAPAPLWFDNIGGFDSEK